MEGTGQNKEKFRSPSGSTWNASELQLQISKKVVPRMEFLRKKNGRKLHEEPVNKQEGWGLGNLSHMSA